MLFRREGEEFERISDAEEATLRADPSTMIGIVSDVGDVLLSTDEADELRSAQAQAGAQPSVPSSISDRQFFQQLAVAGVITEQEALASNAAVIPPPLLAIIDAMPAEDRFGAKMLVSGATVFERRHPMTEAIGSAYGWSAEQIDAFFIAAAEL